jgi:hypothetical protein
MKQFLPPALRPWIFSLLGLLTLLPMACGDPATQSPSACAQAFLDAIAGGDFAHAKDYCTSSTKNNLAFYETFAGFGANPAAGKATVTDEEVNGEYATVYYEKHGKPNSLQLRKEGGEWLVLANKANINDIENTKDSDEMEVLTDKVKKSETIEEDDTPDPAELYKDERAGKSAKETAIAFLDAWFARDFDLASHYASKSTSEAIRMKQGLPDKDEEPKKIKAGHYKFMGIKEKEMTAEATYFDHGDDAEHTLKLVRDQYDNWEVAMEKTDLPSTN